MDARHGRNIFTAPHPAHIAHDTALSPTLIPSFSLRGNPPPPEYAGLTSPALESGKWHMRMPAVEWAKDGPACASRAWLEVHAPLARRAPGFSYVVSDERNVERKSYRVASITAGDYNDDSRYAEWQQVNGNVTPTRPALMAYKSELFNAYQVTLDADRASSAATNHALQLAASDLEYEGTRVKNPVLGRDLNPMGRGDGAYYADGGNTHGGSVAARGVKTALEGHSEAGYGNSVNNITKEERYKLISDANALCGTYLLMADCPSLAPPKDNPCEGLDIHNEKVLCCECIPKLCGNGKTQSCGPKISCLYYPRDEYYSWCASGDEPPGYPPYDPKMNCDELSNFVTDVQKLKLQGVIAEAIRVCVEEAYQHYCTNAELTTEVSKVELLAYIQNCVSRKLGKLITVEIITKILTGLL